MGFLDKFSTFGNRALARGTAKSIVKLYLSVREENKNIDLKQALKLSLIKYDSRASKEYANLLDEEEEVDMVSAIYYVVVESSPMNRNKIFIPENQSRVYIDEIENVLREFNLEN